MIRDCIFRYLDDLLGLNDSGLFDQIFSTVYPKELGLTRTDIDRKQADYLDEKRDHFSFKVINFPCLKYTAIFLTVPHMGYI